MSTMRRPVSAAIRPCRESAARIDAAPGSVKPSASAAEVIVDAVPIVMQWPGERAMPSSIACHCSSVRLPARFSAQYFHTSEPGAQELPAPVAAQHRPRRHEDRRQVHADRAHQHRRGRLVAAAHQHRAVDRIRAQKLLGLHREQVAVHHRRRLLVHLGQRDRRHLEREPARLQDAALHFLRALLEMRMALIDVAPRVDDRDDRACSRSRRANSSSARRANGGRSRACRSRRTSDANGGPRACGVGSWVFRGGKPGGDADARTGNAHREMAAGSSAALYRRRPRLDGRECRTKTTCATSAKRYIGARAGHRHRLPRSPEAEIAMSNPVAAGPLRDV